MGINHGRCRQTTQTKSLPKQLVHPHNRGKETKTQDRSMNIIQQRHSATSKMIIVQDEVRGAKHNQKKLPEHHIFSLNRTKRKTKCVFLLCTCQSCRTQRQHVDGVAGGWLCMLSGGEMGCNCTLFSLALLAAMLAMGWGLACAVVP